MRVAFNFARSLRLFGAVLASTLLNVNAMGYLDGRGSYGDRAIEAEIGLRGEEPELIHRLRQYLDAASLTEEDETYLNGILSSEQRPASLGETTAAKIAARALAKHRAEVDIMRLALLGRVDLVDIFLKEDGYPLQWEQYEPVFDLKLAEGRWIVFQDSDGTTTRWSAFTRFAHEMPIYMAKFGLEESYSGMIRLLRAMAPFGETDTDLPPDSNPYDPFPRKTGCAEEEEISALNAILGVIIQNDPPRAYHLLAEFLTTYGDFAFNHEPSAVENWIEWPENMRLFDLAAGRLLLLEGDVRFWDVARIRTFGASDDVLDARAVLNSAVNSIELAVAKIQARPSDSELQRKYQRWAAHQGNAQRLKAILKRAEWGAISRESSKDNSRNASNAGGDS